MIKKSDGKIGGLEYGAMLFILIGTKIADTTMTMFIRKGETAAGLLNLLSGLIIAIPVILLLQVLKNHPGKGLIEITYYYFGNYIGFVINMLFFLIMLVATVYHSKMGQEGISILFLPKTPRIVIFVLGFLMTLFIAQRGLEVLGRTSYIYIFLFVTTFLLFFVLMYTSDIHYDWRYNYPIFGPGIKELAKGSLFFTSHYGEIILLTAFAPFIRSHQELRRTTIIAFVYIVIATSVFLLAATAIFGYPAINHSAFPFFDITKTYNIGRFIYNLETVFLFIWLMGESIRVSIYVYLLVYMYARIMRMNEFEPLIIPFIFILFSGSLLLRNIVSAIAFRKYTLTYAWIVFLIVPVMLWIMSIVKGKWGQNNHES